MNFFRCFPNGFIIYGIEDSRSYNYMGWICPKCGAVMSLYQSFCINCSRQNWEITYSTSSTAPLKIEDIGNCES